MNLIDISMHHPGFMSFPKSVIAAAAIYLFKQPKGILLSANVR